MTTALCAVRVGANEWFRVRFWRCTVYSSYSPTAFIDANRHVTGETPLKVRHCDASCQCHVHVTHSGRFVPVCYIVFRRPRTRHRYGQGRSRPSVSVRYQRHRPTLLLNISSSERALNCSAATDQRTGWLPSAKRSSRHSISSQHEAIVYRPRNSNGAADDSINRCAVLPDPEQRPRTCVAWSRRCRALGGV
jgi:hypothetical protein